MKALLIAENDKAINNIGTVLKSAGYDIIAYRYFLKALDNIEEIAPHLIVISTEDYPRHWKTLAQFSTTSFGGYIPQIILYTGSDFSEDEKKKAKALNVRGTFSSIDVEGLDELRAILLKTTDIYSGTLTQEDLKHIPDEDLSVITETKEEVPTVESLLSTDDSIAPENEITTEDLIREKFDLSDNLETNKDTADDSHAVSENTDVTAGTHREIKSCSLILINPLTKSLITGICRNYDGSSLDFTADIPSLTSDIEASAVLDGTMNTEEKNSDVLMEVKSLKDNVFHLVLKESL